MTDASLDAPLSVEEPAEELFDSPNTDTTGLSASTPEMVDVEISRFFGYHPGDAIDSADRDYMQTIWNFYAEGAKSQGEVIRRISQAERTIAPPQFGETRLGKFYIYVRLMEESESVKDEISAYKR